MAVLLLKAAMPMLASAAAQAQGKALVEVCTTYGVSLVPLDGGDVPSPSDHAVGHAGDHCVLGALAVLAAPELPGLSVAAAPPGETPRPGVPASSPARDACATWAARLQHGPPVFA